MTRRLPWDFSRCPGVNCPVREQCLLHQQLENMGPRTPILDHSPDRVIITTADCPHFEELSHDHT